MLSGKLLLLEEVRLERNSQMATLKNLEDDLIRKAASLSHRIREEDITKVDTLLRNRDKFVDMCKEVKKEFRQAFKLRLPVYAENQLGENMRLRSVCQEATKDLLQAQARNRILKDRQTSLELEREVQKFAEDSAEDRRASLEFRLQQVLGVYRNLLTLEQEADDGLAESATSVRRGKVENERGTKLDAECSTDLKDRTAAIVDDDALFENSDRSVCTTDKDLPPTASPASCHTENNSAYGVFHTKCVERNLEPCNCPDDPQKYVEDFQTCKSQKDLTGKSYYSTKGHKPISRKTPGERSILPTSSSLINTIKGHDMQRLQLMDITRDVSEIVKDQAIFEERLRQKMAQAIDRNGKFMSALLRAGNIFETRCSKTERDFSAEMDYDLLHQIQMLLDLSQEE